MAYTRTCVICKREFQARYPNTKTCGEDCRDQHKKSYGISYNKIFKTNLSTDYVGAVAEAKVIANLVHRGFEVYKGFWNTPSDLVIIKNGLKYSIQVRTAHVYGGKITYPSDGISSDILALYLAAEERVIYRPYKSLLFRTKELLI